MKKLILAGLVATIGLGSPLAAASRSYADDRAEVENLMSDYLTAFDTLDAPVFVRTFAPDGELVLTGDRFPDVTFQGADGLRKFLDMVRTRNSVPLPGNEPSFSPNIHFFGNLVLTVKGNTATGKAYWFTVRRGENHDLVSEANPNPSKFASIGLYEDQYVRVKGHWLFKRRVIREMHPSVLPANGAAAGH